MGIESIKRDIPDAPCIVRMQSTDDLATVATTGYLFAQANNIAIANSGTFQWRSNDMILMSASDGLGLFTLSADQQSLLAFSSGGGGATVTLPTIANHIAVYTNTSGNLSEDATTAINGGNIQAGLSGTAGNLIAFPAAPSSGSLVLQSGGSAGGDFAATITHDVISQATVYDLIDPSVATAHFIITRDTDPSTFNNLCSFIGTGLIQDAGIASSDVQLTTNIKAGVTGNTGGSGAGPITVTVNGLTSSSIVVGTLKSSSNPVNVLTCIAGTNSFDVTYSADPGASALLNFVAFVAPQ